MKRDTFAKRYFIKVSSSIIVAVLNAVVQLLLPRAFSVEEYGYYCYNLNVFTSVVAMANLSASSAMVSKFSKRNTESGLVYVYLVFTAIVALVLNIGVTILFMNGWLGDGLENQTVGMVLLGLDVSFVVKLLGDVASMFDSLAIARYQAIMNIILKITMAVLVVGGYVLGILNLTVFYFMQLIVTAIIIVIMIFAVLKEIPHKRYGRDEIKIYLTEYFVYCRPLVIATIFSQGVTIIMNWALMRWSGVTGQAMFGVAWQLNTVLGYVFTPYVTLLQREFAVNSVSKEAMHSLYERSVKMMSMLTSYFAMFIAVTGEWMIPIVFGEEYSTALTVIRLIMFYTVFQANGQIFGSYLLATEQTKIQAAIGIIGQILSLCAVFLFQIPNLIFPNSLGSNGIAVNYLVCNCISTLFYAVIVARQIKYNIVKNIASILFTLVLTFSLAILSKSVTAILVTADGKLANVVCFGISGIIYSAILGSFALKWPSVIGISKEKLNSMIRGRGN